MASLSGKELLGLFHSCHRYHINSSSRALYKSRIVVITCVGITSGSETWRPGDKPPCVTCKRAIMFPCTKWRSRPQTCDVSWGKSTSSHGRRASWVMAVIRSVLRKYDSLRKEDVYMSECETWSLGARDRAPHVDICAISFVLHYLRELLLITLRNPCRSVLFLVDVSVCLSVDLSVDLSGFFCPL